MNLTRHLETARNRTFKPKKPKPDRFCPLPLKNPRNIHEKRSNSPCGSARISSLTAGANLAFAFHKVD